MLPQVEAADPHIHRVESGLVLVSRKGEVLDGQTSTMIERMKHYDVPGVSVALIENFHIEWAHSWGIPEAGSSVSLTPDMLFHAGSVAKPVAALAALVLVDRGELDLDEDSSLRLSSWNIPDSEYTRTEKVTLRRLLSHSAGLTDGWTESDVECCYSEAGAAPPVTIQQMLEAHPATGLASPALVTAVPGSRYRYSNLGYGILQLLLTDTTGMSFSHFMQETVLDPLEMTSSTFEQPLPQELRARATTEHDDDARPFPGKRHHFPVRAAGGLWTTPTDLARFVLEIMSSSTGRPSRVLPEPLGREMLTAQISVPDHPIAEAESLGFDLTGRGRGLAFYQTGSTWGSTCMVWGYPETGQGAVIMTNARGGQGLIRLEVLLALAKEYGWPE